MRRRTLLAVLATLALSACSGGGATTPTAAAPKDTLAAAKKAFDAAPSVTFTLASKGVPTTVNGVTAASGKAVVSGSEPKFQGSLTGRVQGVSGSIQLITIGEKAWMKLFTPDYTPVDLASLGAPNPSHFFDPATGISSLLTATENPTAQGQSRDGKDVVTTFSGTLPGAPVKALFNLGDGAKPVAVVWGIAENGELRSARLTGTFYATECTYTLRLTDYGTPVAISAP